MVVCTPAFLLFALSNLHSPGKLPDCRALGDIGNIANNAGQQRNALGKDGKVCGQK